MTSLLCSCSCLGDMLAGEALILSAKIAWVCCWEKNVHVLGRGKLGFDSVTSCVGITELLLIVVFPFFNSLINIQ